jgi:hypothetical protein
MIFLIQEKSEVNLPVLVRIASFNGEEDNSIYRLPTASTKENGSR